ncbi:MAG: acetyl-CoA carboxylase biotin carboxylase subunit [Pseudomonadota bacterium]
MERIGSLLIANRGEIAVRIIRTARARGLRTIAVYSEADQGALHVRKADEAVPIGPAPPAESYLNIAAIIEAARATGADAVHPGYGFLAENADFADAVRAAGLIFVGPPAKAIRAMADKAAAKRTMIAADVPTIPGYEGADQSDAAMLAAAEEIGFPLMVKAALGGGGRGMRRVAGRDALADALRTARAEAETAFGDGSLILERAIDGARHVEVQILADQHGTCLHLGERDCSIQRRHQKLIEEAPSPAVDADLRAEMGAAAVAAAKAVAYIGAGTVEFLLDDAGRYYFLEMNTRLQVEHPVTELITGLDLVALQLDVAEGRPLPFAQDDVALTGHAIEVRLNAEDPAADFAPAAGRILDWRPPAGVRVDAGIETASDVPPHYDSMLAKIIAHGADREEAQRRLLVALGKTVVLGVASNRAFLIDALATPTFAAGEATTAFVAATWGYDGYAPTPLPDAERLAALTLRHWQLHDQAWDQALGLADELRGWSSTGALQTVLRVRIDDGAPETHHLSVAEDAITIDGQHRVETVARRDGTAVLRVDGETLRLAHHAAPDGGLYVVTPTRTLRLEDGADGEAIGATVGTGTATAPMHGVLVEIWVTPGDAVAAGATVATLEAMKMQHAIRAEVGGTVAAVLAGAGQQVAAGDPLVEITPDAAEEDIP